MEKVALALLGVLIGAILQYWFGVLRSKRNTMLALKVSAYADFLKAVSETTFAQRSQDQDRQSRALPLLVEAKARICVYGEPNVVSRMADFWRLGACLDKPGQYQSFIKLVQAMREAGFTGGRVSDDDISQLIIGSNLTSSNNAEQPPERDK